MEMVGATFTTCPFLGKWWIVNLLKTQTRLSHRCSCCFCFLTHLVFSHHLSMWSVSKGICWPNKAHFKLFERPSNRWGSARNELQINFFSQKSPSSPKLLNPSEASLSSVRDVNETLSECLKLTCILVHTFHWQSFQQEARLCSNSCHIATD